MWLPEEICKKEKLKKKRQKKNGKKRVELERRNP